MHTRRQFITTTSAAAIAAATHSFGAPNDAPIKLALIGCGGRGTGACSQNLNTDKGIKLVAMADIA
ncbi:MAG: twin-arginine translocation signal domain-containing protein, partial [Chthoniobacteraceae bacterium]